VGHVNDPVGLAYQTLTHVFCPNGHWDGSVDGLRGLLLFLREETGVSIVLSDVARLRELLEGGPIDEDLLWEWFDTTFPDG
jgi:hypothetical protein